MENFRKLTRSEMKNILGGFDPCDDECGDGDACPTGTVCTKNMSSYCTNPNYVYICMPGGIT